MFLVLLVSLTFSSCSLKNAKNIKEDVKMLFALFFVVVPLSSPYFVSSWKEKLHPSPTPNNYMHVRITQPMIIILCTKKSMYPSLSFLMLFCQLMTQISSSPSVGIFLENWFNAVIAYSNAKRMVNCFGVHVTCSTGESRRLVI